METYLGLLNLLAQKNLAQKILAQKNGLQDVKNSTDILQGKLDIGGKVEDLYFSNINKNIEIMLKSSPNFRGEYDENKIKCSYKLLKETFEKNKSNELDFYELLANEYNVDSNKNAKINLINICKNKINLFIDGANLTYRVTNDLNVDILSGISKGETTSRSSSTTDLEKLFKLFRFLCTSPEFEEKFDNYVIFIPYHILEKFLQKYSSLKIYETEDEQKSIKCLRISGIVDDIPLYIMTMPRLLAGKNYNNGFCTGFQNEFDDYLLILYLLECGGLYLSYDDYNWFGAGNIKINSDKFQIPHEILNIFRANHGLNRNIKNINRYYNLFKLKYPKTFLELIYKINTDYMEKINILQKKKETIEPKKETQTETIVQQKEIIVRIKSYIDKMDLLLSIFLTKLTSPNQKNALDILNEMEKQKNVIYPYTLDNDIIPLENINTLDNDRIPLKNITSQDQVHIVSGNGYHTRYYSHNPGYDSHNLGYYLQNPAYYSQNPSPYFPPQLSPYFPKSHMPHMRRMGGSKGNTTKTNKLTKTKNQENRKIKKTKKNNKTKKIKKTDKSRKQKKSIKQKK
jgi:hypothetical protein